jgi:hypothetical protein
MPKDTETVMARGWIAGLLGGREGKIAEPLAFFGEALLSREAVAWAGTEAIVVVAVSAALALIGWLGQGLADPEPAVIAASLVLLAYVAHIAWKLPVAARLAWLAWRLRLPPRRLGLFVLHRAVLAGMRRVERTVENELPDAAWYVRGAAAIGSWWTAVPHDKVAWRIAEATAPLLWREAVQVAALVLAPLLLVIAVFRMSVTYGLLLDRAAHLDVIDALLYPFAAVCDVLFGTDLRTILKGA